jgi:hypothetical protein
VPETISIPARFNGPVDSANGGYTSGVIAGLLDGTAEVSLRSPVPLDTELAVERDGDGAVRIRDGETLIAEAHAAPAPELEVPESVSPDQAHRATRRYRGLDDSLFSHCFVCGRAREDAFRVFAGPVEGSDLVASPWTPGGWVAGDDGRVRPEHVWAALDCPTYFALYSGRDELPLSFLGRFSARIDAPVPAGEELVVIGWPIEVDGRKHHAGSAVLSGDGQPLAVARALLIGPSEDA